VVQKADFALLFFLFHQAALADGTLVPEHKDDFERMLIAQPNSSFLWVQYMAHHLQSAAIDAARAVAARALRTIDYREEDVSIPISPH
jgi:rRNA biogenesis protein RRP5